MKSKFTTRSSSRQGPVITNNYAKAVVKGGPKKKKVKTIIYKTTTDHSGKTVTGSGKITKRVYKNGILKKKPKVKNMSMKQMLLRP